MAPANPLSFVQSILGPASPIPTPCLVLKGMFDPAECVIRASPPAAQRRLPVHLLFQACCSMSNARPCPFDGLHSLRPWLAAESRWAMHRPPCDEQGICLQLQRISYQPDQARERVACNRRVFCAFAGSSLRPSSCLSTRRETEPDWDLEIAADTKEECAKFGQVLHLHVDRNSKVT